MFAENFSAELILLLAVVKIENEIPAFTVGKQILITEKPEVDVLE